MSTEGNALSIVLPHEERKGLSLPASDCDSEDFDASGSAQYPLDGLNAIPDDFSPLAPYDSVLVFDTLEDKRLRKMARPMRPLDCSVVLSEKGHPAFLTVCDTCGTLVAVLSHCGRPLCIPCQRKRVARYTPLALDGLLRVMSWLENQNLLLNKRMRVRFVTLTLKNVPMGRLGENVGRVQKAYQILRRRSFWREHDVQGDMPRVEWTLTETGWHIHIHSIVASGFIPDRLDMQNSLGEGNLRDEWFSITGDSMVVQIESVSSPKDAVRELVKYLFKPTDDKNNPVVGWAEDARREASEVIVGRYRVGWYCESHHSRTRSDCLSREIETPLGFIPLECTGKYRLERQGFRPLLPSGIFRVMMSESERERDSIPSNCPHCGLGTVHGKTYWNARARECGMSTPCAHSALDLIRTHETTDSPSMPRLNLLAEHPSGWIPPPPYEDFIPELRASVVEMLRRSPQDLDALVEYLCIPCKYVHSLELALLSLTRLGVVYRAPSGVYELNERLLERLTRESI